VTTRESVKGDSKRASSNNKPPNRRKRRSLKIKLFIGMIINKTTSTSINCFPNGMVVLIEVIYLNIQHRKKSIIVNVLCCLITKCMEYEMQNVIGIYITCYASY